METNNGSADRCEALAAQLTTEAEDGWRFEAVHPADGRGFSFVRVFDEAGFEVGEMRP
jgi:hypothetical protein